MLQINAAAVTHPGNFREKNEDNFCFFRTVIRKPTDHKQFFCRRQSLRDLAVLGVFDGMGGIESGENASLLAAETAASRLKHSVHPSKDMQEACRIANEKICAEMLHCQKRMGSTASMLCVKEQRYDVCNLGDSPVFHLHHNQLTCISKAQIEQPESSKKHGETPRKGRLLQYLGIFPQETALQPYIASGRCSVGDRFLLCSDGLSDVVPPAVIRKELCKSLPMREIAQNLLELAMKNGSMDNITVICAEIVDTKLFRWI